MEDKEKKQQNFKVNLAIMLAVLLIFGGIILFTGILGAFFGKTVENIVLILIAAALVFLLLKSKRS